MILYWILLILTAFIAYLFGSLDTMVIASNFVFRRNLRRLGNEATWFSNFRRVYGLGGFLRLLVIELIKDIIPILIGGLLLGIKGHGEVGRAFAGFCLVLGRLYPAIYVFRGGSAALAMVVAGCAASMSVGIAAGLVMLGVIIVSRYVSLGVFAGAFVYAALSVVMLGESIMLRLAIFTAGLVLIKHIPAIIRVLRKREPRIGFAEDITYKLDE
ncbi:MAG: glycerol-3-phosphate acyltransferase [Oscillospiraceae bacterium]|nr:glycerol-3-phosphate acyltransferase [Oscillospiraceae bacterium]